MIQEERFRAEWAMASDCPKAELLPCYCYEYEREFIHDRMRPKPDREPIGELSWMKQFESPYLLLDRKERKRIAVDYPSYFNKKLTDFHKGNRSDTEILRDVTFWLSLRKSTSRTGQAAFAAKLRTGLRYLGAYRILQKYRWNRLPNTPGDIGLFNGQREWINARKDAAKIIQIWPLILFGLLRTPQK